MWESDLGESRSTKTSSTSNAQTCKRASYSISAPSFAARQDHWRPGRMGSKRCALRSRYTRPHEPKVPCICPVQGTLGRRWITLGVERHAYATNFRFVAKAFVTDEINRNLGRAFGEVPRNP